MGEYRIIVTLEEAMKKRGIDSQKQLVALVKEKTGKNLRAATISDIFNDKGRSINREYLEAIAEALEIKDLNELIKFNR